MGFIRKTMGSLSGGTKNAEDIGQATDQQIKMQREAIAAQEDAYGEILPGMAQFMTPQQAAAFGLNTGTQGPAPDRYLSGGGARPPGMGGSFGGYGGGGRQVNPAYTEWQERNSGPQYMAPDQNSALEQLRSATGIYGNERQQEYYDNFTEDPGTQFLREQGQGDIDRQLAARGGLGGGSRLKAVSKFNQGLANQQLDKRMAQLGSLAQTDIGMATGLSNLRTGLGTAQAQSLSDIGTAFASGTKGQIEATQAGREHMLGVGNMIGSFFSDSALKENLEEIGEFKGCTLYVWDWNEEAAIVGADEQSPLGCIAQEVQELYPDMVVASDTGYLKIKQEFFNNA